MNIKTAFLQGEQIDREVYIHFPLKGEKNVLWPLNKCICGLTDASLSWYCKVKHVMLQCGTLFSPFDPAVFFLHQDGVLRGAVAVHVGDFMWSGCKEFEERVVMKLREIFQVGKEESISFKFLGLQLKSNKGKVFLCQNQYIADIQPAVLSKLRRQNKDDTLSDTEQKSLRLHTERILWASKVKLDQMLPLKHPV